MKSYVVINERERERVKTRPKNVRRRNGFMCSVLLFLGGWLLLFPQYARAANCGDPSGLGGTANQCNCGDTVTASTTLNRDLDCSGSSTDGLIVGANNITIDGNSHIITGSGGTSTYYGINSSISPYYNNIVVKNLILTGFKDGIYLKSSTGSTIQNVTANSNNTYGIFLSSSNSNTLTDNTANSNPGAGIFLYSSSNSNTLTGNTANLNSTGISLSSSNLNTIASSTANSNNCGIQLYKSLSNILTGNTANSNNTYGIYLSSSNSNTLTGNTANLNSTGISLSSSNLNTIASSTANSNNTYGIYLSSSNSNPLTGNIMSGNIGGNLYVTGSFNNTIDTTNTVEGKSVYYLYENPTTHLAMDGITTYDGNVYNNPVGGIGMFWCINCTNVTVENVTLSVNNYYSVYFKGTTGSTINNVIANSYSNTNTVNRLNTQYGIYLSSSNSNTLTGNTTNSDTYGIYLSSSNSNTLTGNTTNSDTYGIFLYSSSNSNTLTGNTTNSDTYGIYLSSSNSNTLTGNMLLNNANDLYNIGTTNTYSHNNFLYNANNKMLISTESTRVKNVDDIISFTISMFDPNGNVCSNTTLPNCSATVITSPLETVTFISTGNQVTASFIATRSGTYSLIFTVTDSNLNTVERKIIFLVGDTNTQTTTYYLRNIVPTHGQPAGADSKSMILTAPTSTETWNCAVWIQNSPDAIPVYPLSNLSGINSYTWYTSGGGFIGVQRYVSYSVDVDASSSVPSASSYAWINTSLTNLNWGMDYPQSWYWLSLKINASPYWQTTAAQPSYADFTYSYTTTPAIKSVSNPNIDILSATASSTATNIANIVLENPSSAATSTDVVLTGFKRPFLGATSTIDSTATTTISTPAITANATSSFSSVPMDITPSTGSVAVNINTWNTSGDYSKEWTETGDTHSATASHIIGDLKANTYYTVKVDSSTFHTYLSDGSGQISFTYNGGYSSHTFDITEETTPPAVSLTVPSSGSTVSGSAVSLSATVSDTGSGMAGVQFKLDGTTNIGSEITATSSPDTYTAMWNSTGITSYGSHTLYAVARDVAGNYATSTVAVNVDNVAPTLVSAIYDSDTQITVTLSKPANASTVTKSNDGGFTVTKTGSGTTYAVASIAPGSDNTKAVLTVASMLTSGGTGVKVTYSNSGNGTVADTLGNLLATDNTGITIPPWNTTAPIISSITSTVSNGAYKLGSAIDIDLTFSKAVNTTGSVVATLNTGGTCSFSGISNSTTASCTYTVGSGENTATLNVTSVAGTITSTDSNVMTSFAPALNLSANKSIVIDTTAPTVSLTAPSSGSTVSGTSVTLSATDSDAGSGIAGVQFKLDGTTNISTEGLMNPYSITWDSTSASNASHTLYAVARDTAGNYATSTVTVTVKNNVPDSPTVAIATAGNAQATVSFAAPADNGGASIIGYTVISNPSGGTDCNAGMTALTHTITGLTNGTAYTFTVTATNANGTSIPSSVSNSVTPVAPTVPTTPVVMTSFSSGGGGSASSQVNNLLNMGFYVQAQAIAKQYGIAIPLNIIPQATTTVTTIHTIPQLFTRTLRLGMTDTDVKRIQIFLNTQGFTVAQKGAGSPGRETNYFGQATRAALMRFQQAHKKETLDPQGLKSPTGLFGMYTMRVVNGMMK